jgi:GABA(A) receptor-associated protein
MKDVCEMSFDERLKTSSGLKEKHPDRIPLILTREKNRNLPEFTSLKFLVPFDCTIAKLIINIRKQIKIRDTDCIYLSFNNRIFKNSDVIVTMYERFKNKDGFLYGVISTEHTFG